MHGYTYNNIPVNIIRENNHYGHMNLKKYTLLSKFNQNTYTNIIIENWCGEVWAIHT
jgi:hypothetical protein